MTSWPQESEARDPGLMYIRCAYCGKWIDVKPGQVNWITHGLCTDCFAKEVKKISPSAEPGAPREGADTGEMRK